MKEPNNQALRAELQYAWDKSQTLPPILFSESEADELIAALTTDRHAEGRLAGLEEAAKVAENPGFIEARDTEWDTGVNYAKRYIATAIRAIAKAGQS